MHLPRDPLALLFLRVDDGLKQAALVDQRRGVGRKGRRAVLSELTLRRREDLGTAVDELALGLERVELAFHRHAPPHRRRVLVGRAEDLLALEAAWVPPNLLDLRLHLVLARLEAVDLRLRRLDEEVELADLGRYFLLLGRDIRENVRGCHRQLPISGPLIHPCRIA